MYVFYSIFGIFLRVLGVFGDTAVIPIRIEVGYGGGGNIIFPDPNTNTNQILCYNNHGRTFPCVPISECASARKQLRRGRRPNICSWNNDVPLVCCRNYRGLNPYRPYNPDPTPYRPYSPTPTPYRPYSPTPTPYRPYSPTPYRPTPTPYRPPPPKPTVQKPNTPIIIVEDPNKPIEILPTPRTVGPPIVNTPGPYVDDESQPNNNEREIGDILKVPARCMQHLTRSKRQEPSISLPEAETPPPPDNGVLFVAGGKPANANDWPWMAAIYQYRKGRREFWCGGSLIGSKYVLTAAHCFDFNKNMEDYEITLGDLDINSNKDDAQPETFKVKSLRIHPSYVKQLHYNDMALMKLPRDVTYNKYIEPLCLPPKEDWEKTLVNKTMVVAGWGHTEFGGAISSVLQQATILAMKREDCDNAYKQVSSYKTRLPRGITNELLCAGLPEGGVDACQGDSGGPLMYTTSEGQWAQAGIVAFGVGCGQPEFPGVYTRVGKFMNWIQTTVKEME